METPGIINTDIIDPAIDNFFAENGKLNDLPQRGVLVLVQSFRNTSEEGQLQKMLQACQLTPADYNLVTLNAGEQLSWQQLREKLNPSIVFLLGVLPVQLGISALFRLNEPNRFDDKTWLPTLAISDLEQHAEVKKQLWVSGMKPIFVDKKY
jgi:hypothetical protein